MKRKQSQIWYIQTHCINNYFSVNDLNTPIKIQSG